MTPERTEPDAHRAVSIGCGRMAGMHPHPRPPHPEIEFTADCEARIAFDVLANRWDSVVIFTLGDAGGPMRPRALRARIGGISPKVLNEALRRLQYNGLVARRAYAEAPPRVDYALTEAGTALLVPMRAMGAWAKRHASDVLASQERHEEQPGRNAGLAGR